MSSKQQVKVRPQPLKSTNATTSYGTINGRIPPSSLVSPDRSLVGRLSSSSPGFFSTPVQSYLPRQETAVQATEQSWQHSPDLVVGSPFTPAAISSDFWRIPDIEESSRAASTSNEGREWYVGGSIPGVGSSILSVETVGPTPFPPFRTNSGREGSDSHVDGDEVTPLANVSWQCDGRRAVQVIMPAMILALQSVVTLGIFCVLVSMTLAEREAHPSSFWSL